jgi:hypothetical protein
VAGGIPDPQRAAFAAADDHVPVAEPADRHRTHRSAVAGERAYDGAADGIQIRTVPSLLRAALVTSAAA